MRYALAVCLSAQGAKLASGRWTVEQSRAGCGLPLQNGARAKLCADLSSGAAGKVVETAQSCAGCRARKGSVTGADRCELGGGELVSELAPCSKKSFGISDRLDSFTIFIRNLNIELFFEGHHDL